MTLPYPPYGLDTDTGISKVWNIIRIRNSSKTMALERYFATLAQDNGAETFCLVNDNAVSSSNKTSTSASPIIRLKKTRTSHQKFSSNDELSATPLKCPIRKTSLEELLKQCQKVSLPPSSFRNQTVIHSPRPSKISGMLLKHLSYDLSPQNIRKNPSAA